MSDRSLREALETLAGELEYDVAGAPGKIRALLAAHPAEPAPVHGSGCGVLQDPPSGCDCDLSEPAPVVTDEAVEVGEKAWTKAYWAEATPGRSNWMRAALEAAAPLLGSRPLIDREEVSRAFRREAGPWLTADRDAVTDAATDAVMELARPMPTREQIGEVLHRDNHRLGSEVCVQPRMGELTNCYESTMHDARRVLALLNGAES